ncbi:Zn-ribbon domain-containing OB-fold protein [Frankia gtarii]|uniref:Zn-ribbon domain-containing OB-fold protein n=1 Tax=Frankia gtarii TaxID=2950102 RepID=UPI0021C178ED|nr:OB-fold domain-containing protein [Frankia gtarii]
MTAHPDAPVPVTTDLDTGGFWQAAAHNRLALRACLDCGTVLHLPKVMCHRCRSTRSGWREIEPVGTLASWTVVRAALHPAFPPPYTIVLVELDAAPGARLIGYLDGAPDLAMGQPMRATFQQVRDQVTLVQWSPLPAVISGPSPDSLVPDLS